MQRFDFIDGKNRQKMKNKPGIVATIAWMKLAQVLIEILREEGGEWRHNDSHCRQDLVQHVKSEKSLRIAILSLDAHSIQSHVPFGQIFNELH